MIPPIRHPPKVARANGLQLSNLKETSIMRNYHNKLARVVAILFKIDVHPLTSHYSSLYLFLCKHKGKAKAAEILSNLNKIGEQTALRQTITPMTWFRSDSDGFPEMIKPFKVWLRSENQHKVIAALSVLRSYELLRVPISKDISTITEPYTGESDILDSITNFIPVFLKSSKIDLKIPEIEYHMTYKNGPNGPALRSSDSDIEALSRIPKLVRAIRTCEGKLAGSPPAPLKELSLFERIPFFLGRKKTAITSKLTQFPEKGGKTRTIAVIDYYSQRCLKPLHKALMTALSSLVSDGTYSHRNVATWLQQRTYEKSYLYCCDMTAATDRFPSIIQKNLLLELVKDPDLSAAIWTLLAERTFTVAWSGEEITYNVGQPMGAYASWPLFALSHHLLVEYCAFKHNIRKCYTKYRIIGDDVVISDQRIAQEYKVSLKALGLKVKPTSTFECPSKSEKSGGEVAKQLFLNGVNVTPLTPGFIDELKLPYMLNAYMGELKFRYNTAPTVPADLIEGLFRRERDRCKAWLHCSNPWNGSIVPTDVAYKENSPWANRVLDLSNPLMGMILQETIQDSARTILDSTKGTKANGEHQPNWAELQASQNLLVKLKSKLNELLYTKLPSDRIPRLVDYLPDPNSPFKVKRRQIGSAESRLLYTIIKLLPIRSMLG
jgi:hypothetical protein